MFGWFGKFREWMNWKVHKVYLVRIVGGSPETGLVWRVVKVLYLREDAREFVFKKKAYPFRPKGVAVEFKNTVFHFRDLDSGAVLRLNELDHVVTVKGRFISPEELDAQNASRDMANVNKGGLVNDWIVAFVFLLLGVGIGMFVWMLFGGVVLKAIGG